MSVSDAVRLLPTRIAPDKALPFDPFTSERGDNCGDAGSAARQAAQLHNVDALMRGLHAEA
jgi:antitoxin component of RelBE/YafQ-DinJ toxin-antitoxin module